MAKTQSDNLKRQIAVLVLKLRKAECPDWNPRIGDVIGIEVMQHGQGRGVTKDFSICYVEIAPGDLLNAGVMVTDG